MKKLREKWVNDGDESIPDLDSFLNFASDNFKRHTDWHLRHREAGIRMLTLLLTAEFAIVGFYYTTNFKIAFIALIGLAILSFLSIILTYLALMSCSQSYKASLENALLITKILWLKGLTKPIKIKFKQIDISQCPVREDETLYVPRYLHDAQKHLTTDEFVEYNMSKIGTTYFATKTSILLLGILGFLAGAGAIILILLKK